MSTTSQIFWFPLTEGGCVFIAEAAYAFCLVLLEAGPHCPIWRFTPHWDDSQESLNHTPWYFRYICRNSNSYQSFQLSLQIWGEGEFAISLDNVTHYLLLLPLNTVCLTSSLNQIISASHLSLLSKMHCMKEPVAFCICSLWEKLTVGLSLFSHGRYLLCSCQLKRSVTSEVSASTRLSVCPSPSKFKPLNHRFYISVGFFFLFKLISETLPFNSSVDLKHSRSVYVYYFIPGEELTPWLSPPWLLML